MRDGGSDDYWETSPPWWEVYERLAQRTHLVIWGGCDYVLPASQAQAAVDRLPDGRLALFADCGHLPHVEWPDRFVTVLSEGSPSITTLLEKAPPWRQPNSPSHHRYRTER